MIFTIIAIVIRCFAETAWGDEASLTGLCNVIFWIYIVLCAIGIIETFLGRYDRSIPSTIVRLVFQIAASIYFVFAANSIVGKIIGIAVGAIIFGLIISALPEGGGGDPPGYGSGDLFDTSESTNDILARKDAERERYVRQNWNSSRGRLNSDATFYETSDGQWCKISRDGHRYEDRNGNWQNL